MSLDVGGRHSAARRAQDAKARDIASLLTARSALARLETPQSFTDLAGDGYLALIHADGNGVGSGAMNGDVADRANFFHANRVLLRRAVAAAVARVCPQDGMAPLAILMLGGDDLLVACRADTAMRFVVELCDQLDIMQRARSGFQLTLGIGIVFSRPKVPVHRLHQVVEELTASAKTQFRALPEGATRSLVDWAVYSTAWVEGPMNARRRDWLRGTQHLRVLSQRPLPVLGEGLGALQGLLDASEQLRDASRSQLRTLAEQLFLGRQLAELYYRELSGTARKILQSVGLVGVWAEMGDVVSTPVLDLVEVSEIPRLGRTPRDDRPLMMTSREMEDAHVEA